MDFLKKFFTFFEKKPSDFPGAILPEKTDLAGIPTFDEIVAAENPVDWQPLDLNKIPQYPVRNQDGSSSCVAFTVALMCSIMYFLKTGTWIDFSASWVYSQRSNKPGLGMVGTNAFSIAEKGMIPEDFCPSDDLSEERMSAPKVFEWYNKIAEVFGFDTRIILTPLKDIETIASIIQTTGKPVMVWFEFGESEWRKVPSILSIRCPYRHSVTAIPPSKPGEMTVGMYEGEPAIVIQDSWGKDLETIGGRRIIKRSFFNRRNIFGAYLMRFKFEVSLNTPVFDGTIVSAQKCLQVLGYFPTNVSFVENLGPVTREAIRKFQSANGLVVNGTLSPETKELLAFKFK